MSPALWAYSKCSLVVSPFCYVDSINLPLAFKKQVLGFEMLIRMTFKLDPSPLPLWLSMYMYTFVCMFRNIYFPAQHIWILIPSLLYLPICPYHPMSTCFLCIYECNSYSTWLFLIISLNQVFVQAKDKIKFGITSI